MSRDALTGSRIRERRTMAGKKQAELAKQSGISASYLNLIEHNRRRIGGKLLLNIANALGVEPQTLTDGAEAALIASLREAAEDVGLTGPETAHADEFAGRFPGWADVLAKTRRRIATLEQTVEALTDRLAHDPHLAASMHELLSTAAAIRSTAAILAENEVMQPAQRIRFHANIDEDSKRLSDSAQALVGYLDASEGTSRTTSSSQEEVEAFLSAHEFQFDELENRDADSAQIDALIAGAPELRTLAARHIALSVLEQVADDARELSLEDLRRAIAKHGADPATLARHLRQPIARILRRLAALSELGAGLVVADRSGTVLFRKSVEGFTVPRHGSCCPLWPLFAVTGQPGLVVSERIAQLGRSQPPFQTYATSEADAAQDYNAPPLVRSTMLLVPAAEGSGAARQVGATCRVCPHAKCAARREPSIVASDV